MPNELKLKLDTFFTYLALQPLIEYINQLHESTLGFSPSVCLSFCLFVCPSILFFGLLFNIDFDFLCKVV